MKHVLLIIFALTSPLVLANEPHIEVKSHIDTALPTGDFNHSSWFKAAEKLKTSLHDNVPWAKYYASFLYTYGAGGFPEDLVKARELASSSAEEGFLPAMLDQARRNEYGLSGAIDIKKAVVWYEKAALAGSRSAAERLEEAYSKGELELKPDQRLADKWRKLKGECKKPKQVVQPDRYN